LINGIGKTNATIITPKMLEPGMHINGAGGDCTGKTEMGACLRTLAA
jgi:ornithine cyclodeaminase